MTDCLIPQPQPHLLCADDWTDYELLDSGDCRSWSASGATASCGRNRRRCGRRASVPMSGRPRTGVSSPAPGANEDDEEGGGWSLSETLPRQWPVSYDGLRFIARPTPFRHLGFFPEQAPHWRWCAGLIDGFAARHGRAPRILNLFAYSGVASLHAARAGAEVVHVDASRKAIAQAFENRDEAGLAGGARPLHHRGCRTVCRTRDPARPAYDGILLDPPKYGRGPKGERWRIETDLVPLLAGCRRLLSDTPLFLLLTIYAIRASSQAAHYALAETMREVGGEVTSGELVSVEGAPAPRVISQANFARWTQDANS